MKFVPKPILFSPLSIIKLYSGAFGISLPEKTRDELENIHLSYNRYRFLPDEVVSQPLKDKVTSDYLEAVREALFSSISMFNEFIQRCTFEGLTADETREIVWKDLYSAVLGKALHFIHHIEPGLPSLHSLIASDDLNHATEQTLQGLDQDATWSEFKSRLIKEDRDKLRRWCRTEELPSITKITSLLESSFLDADTKEMFATRLLHARFIDSLKRGECSKIMFSAIRNRLRRCDFDSYAMRERDSICRKHTAYFDEITRLNGSICRAKLGIDIAGYLQELRALRKKFSTEPRSWAFKLHVDWLTAQSYLYQGELKRACRLYGKTIDLVSSFAPESQYLFLSEALMCASITGKSGDTILLKKAKNLAIVYGLMPSHDHPEEWPKKAFDSLSDFVKPYEIDDWQRQLKNQFPNARIDFDNVPLPFLIASMENQRFTSPNRKSKISGSNSRLEQLSQAVQRRDYSAIKNMLNDSYIARMGNLTKGHNPLIIALQNFVVKRSAQDRNVVLWLLAKLKTENRDLVKKLLSIRTDKRKLTALSLAIDSYDKEIVLSLIELGAPVNLRASPEFVTPLLYAMRRVAECLGSTPRNQYLKNARRNVEILLEYGADPNLTHELPGPGFTAGMLAAELDEVEILKLFHTKGMNLTSTYFFYQGNRSVGLEDIASYFKSTNVLAYLKSSAKKRQ